VQQGNPDVLVSEVRSMGVAQEVKELIIKFSATAVASLIGSALGV